MRMELEPFRTWVGVIGLVVWCLGASGVLAEQPTVIPDGPVISESDEDGIEAPPPGSPEAAHRGTTGGSFSPTDLGTGSVGLATSALSIGSSGVVASGTASSDLSLSSPPDDGASMSQELENPPDDEGTPPKPKKRSSSSPQGDSGERTFSNTPAENEKDDDSGGGEGGEESVPEPPPPQTLPPGRPESGGESGGGGGGGGGCPTCSTPPLPGSDEPTGLSVPDGILPLDYLSRSGVHEIFERLREGKPEKILPLFPEHNREDIFRQLIDGTFPAAAGAGEGMYIEQISQGKATLRFLRNPNFSFTMGLQNGKWVIERVNQLNRLPGPFQPTSQMRPPPPPRTSPLPSSWPRSLPTGQNSTTGGGQSGRPAPSGR